MAITLAYNAPSETLSKTQRRCTVGYVPARGDTTTPLLKLSGKWLREAGFDTGTGVTVKVSGDCIVLIPDNSEIQELRKQLRQAHQVIENVREGIGK